MSVLPPATAGAAPLRTQSSPPAPLFGAVPRQAPRFACARGGAVLEGEGLRPECESSLHTSARALLRGEVEGRQEFQHRIRPPERPRGQAPEVGRVVESGGRVQHRVKMVERLQVVRPHPDLVPSAKLHLPAAGVSDVRQQLPMLAIVLGPCRALGED